MPDNKEIIIKQSNAFSNYFENNNRLTWVISKNNGGKNNWIGLNFKKAGSNQYIVVYNENEIFDRGGVGTVLQDYHYDGNNISQVLIKKQLAICDADIYSCQQESFWANKFNLEIAPAITQNVHSKGTYYYHVMHNKGHHLPIYDLSIGLDKRLDYLLQISLAVDKIHGQKCVHSDIKTENCVINNDGIISIVDFGMATSIPKNEEQITQGTTYNLPVPMNMYSLMKSTRDVVSVLKNIVRGVDCDTLAILRSAYHEYLANIYLCQIKTHSTRKPTYPNILTTEQISHLPEGYKRLITADFKTNEKGHPINKWDYPVRVTPLLIAATTALFLYDHTKITQDDIIQISQNKNNQHRLITYYNLVIAIKNLTKRPSLSMASKCLDTHPLAIWQNRPHSKANYTPTDFLMCLFQKKGSKILFLLLSKIISPQPNANQFIKEECWKNKNQQILLKQSIFKSHNSEAISAIEYKQPGQLHLNCKH